MADGRTSEPRLVSRVLVTWVELLAVGIAGGALGTTVGGPPGFIVLLFASLLAVGVLLYNVNELVVRATNSPDERHGDVDPTGDDGGDAPER